MNDVGSKLLNCIKSMSVNSLACARVRESESLCFRIDSGVRQGVACPLGFSMYIWMQ